MTLALNRMRGRSAADGGMFDAVTKDVLLHADAQPTIHRLFSACCPDSTIDVEEHVLRVAAVTLTARQRPMTRFGRPTL